MNFAWFRSRRYSRRSRCIRNKTVHNGVNKILASKEIVPRSCAHLHNPVVHLQDGYVERTASEIEDEDFAVGLGLLESVRKRSRRWFIQKPFDPATGNFARRLRGLALRVIKVGWHRNDRLADRTAKKCFSVCFQ